MDSLKKSTLTEHSKQSTRLRKFLSFNDPFILISGAPKCGKTKLLAQIDRYFRASSHVIHIDTQPNLKPEDFFKLLTTECKLPPIDSQLTISCKLNQIITHINQQHNNYVLIFDDAHLLPFATLAAIQHLALQLESKSIKLQLLLAGEPDLSTKMRGFFKGISPEIKLTREIYKHLILSIPKTQYSLNKSSRQQTKFRILSLCSVVTIGLCFATMARYYEHQTNFYFIPSDPSNITIIH